VGTAAVATGHGFEPREPPPAPRRTATHQQKAFLSPATSFNARKGSSARRRRHPRIHSWHGAQPAAHNRYQKQQHKKLDFWPPPLMLDFIPLSLFSVYMRMMHDGFGTRRAWTLFDPMSRP
jgi:hypothetical protein